MKRYYCQCGHETYFNNLHCNACGSQLGFDPDKQALISLYQNEREPYWLSHDGAGHRYQLCQHRDHEIQCNWLIDANSSHVQCMSCRLTRTIPMLSKPNNIQRWAVLESSKRRMIYGLLEMGLSVIAYTQEPDKGLAFDFLEDKRSNPMIDDEYVYSGHAQGVITMNVAEADSSYREATREALNESYRSLLGHFRHEVGHYYWERLVLPSSYYQAFQQLFGDEKQDYTETLNNYYNKGPVAGWEENYISAYASMHPLEDWAETWAHYMLMRETIETAFNLQILPTLTPYSNFDVWMDEWMQLVVVLNALNRSIGNADAYPFTISSTVRTKLKFIHQLVNG